MRLAIVTAYYKEERAVIERCIESIRAQTVPVEHFVIADGHPQEWVAAAGVRHLVLDRSHGDFGDTPRAMGLTLAIREGFDAIQFLDADNVVYPRNAELVTATLGSSGAHMAVLKRHHLRPDGSILKYWSAAIETLAHIDTNCYVFSRPSFPTALKWLLIPRELSYMGDKVFRSVFSQAGHPVAVVPEPTVGYSCMWPDIYRAAGEEPPPGCRDVSSEREHAAAWWNGLDAARREEIQAALGVRINVV